MQGTKRLHGGKYELYMSKKLGVGEYAEVYLGCKTEFKEIVVIKSINKTRIGDHNMKQNIYNQIDSLKKNTKFENPYIIKILDCFESANNFYIVTEFCNSGKFFLLMQ